MKSERKEIDFDLLKRLFWVMFSLSACTFGGGFVIVSLMKKKVVEEQHWLEEDEMLGSLVAVFGTILPPMILLSVIAVFYDQFRSNETIKTALAVMRAGVAAVIFDVVINLAKNVITTKRILYIALMIITFIMGYFLKVSAMIIILSCLGTGLICVIYDLITQQEKEKKGDF